MSRDKIQMFGGVPLKNAYYGVYKSRAKAMRSWQGWANKIRKRARHPKTLSAPYKAHLLKYKAMARFLTLTTCRLWSVDHIVPLNGEKVSGLHVPWNLKVVLHSNNERKGNSYATDSGNQEEVY